MHASLVCALGKSARAVFSLPCVLDARSFTHLVNKQGKLVEQMLLTRALKGAEGGMPKALEAKIREDVGRSCEPLTALKQKEVESTIADSYGLKHDCLATCLVPYRLGVNIILKKLPPCIRRECVDQLKEEETAILEKRSGETRNRWLAWEEADVYVSTGTKYLDRVDVRSRERIPIFSVLGHVGHGKTTLLDALLQQTSVAPSEPHGLTQTVRAFTVSHPTLKKEFFTFIDSPGHKIFVESRFHSQVVCDCVVLVVSVVDGVQVQTHEVIKVALNADKPIIVALTKLDLLSDSLAASQRVHQVLSELKEIGLDVTMVYKDADLVEHDATARTTSNHALSTQAVYYLPMRKIDASFKGSLYKPVVQLQRKCLGVCLSATKHVNIPLLWRLLREWRDTAHPTCRSNSVKSDASNCVVQAVVIESSKHLFDEEGFRQNKLRQSIQRRLDRQKGKSEVTRERTARLDSLRQRVWRHTHQGNRTSTNSLVVSVIVREGVVSEGMHFVADQAEGRVDYIMDYWGNRLGQALPGMAVTLVDAHSLSGCPGVGVHVLSMVDERNRFDVRYYRQQLQWFIECFPDKLHLLKPRGMNVAFAHLGDYGQLDATEYLAYQLLYGSPTSGRRPPGPVLADAKEASPVFLPPPPPSASAGEKSIAEYLTELNSAGEVLPRSGYLVSTATASSSSSATLVDGKRTEQAILSPCDAEVLDVLWRAMQPKHSISSKEEYAAYLQQCTNVGVLLKVDSYHAGRMLVREIPRLQSAKVALHVVGVRFGPLTAEDLLFFGLNAKIVICYRTPYAPNSDVDQYINVSDHWLLHTDHFADVLMFIKWCVVAMHKKVCPDGDDESLADRKYVVMKPNKKTEDAPARRSKLLVYNGDETME